MKKLGLLLAFLPLAALAGCGQRTETPSSQAPGERAGAAASDEQAIRDLIQRYGAAVEARDLDAIMSFYAPDLVAYDAFMPRQYAGSDAYQQAYEGFFAAFPGPVTSEILDLDVATAGGLGVAHGVERWTVTGEDGQPMDFVWRFTDVFRRAGGEWRIVHEHISFPADPQTGMADYLSKP